MCRDPKLRARTNRKSTHARLDGDAKLPAPPLPKLRNWHVQTRAFWRDIWHSPMATQYVPADHHGLLRLLVLVDDFWHSDSNSARVRVHAEARSTSVEYRLSSLARSRLQ